MSKRTPGPYWCDPDWKPGSDIGCAIYAGVGSFPLHVATASPRRNEEEVCLLVDLLNKGTHADRLAEALREAREALDHFADLEARDYGDDPCQDAAHALVSIDAALAKYEESAT